MANFRPITGLDVGSYKISALCGLSKENKESPEFEVLSCVSRPSSGLRRGVVIEPEKVARTIREISGDCERESGQKIKEVFLNINGSHIYSVFSHGTIAVSRADKKISQEDIDRVLEAAQTFSLPPNREILNVFPKEFIIDGEKGISDPLGMEGVRLEVEILALCGFVPYIRNLEKAVSEASLQIADLIFTPLASAGAVLTSKEKELGVLLLDIGGGTSAFSIFREQNLIGAGVIPIGSIHITNDIAAGLKTDLETAERIKRESGSCFLSGAKKIRTKEKNGEDLIFSQKTLGRIIDCRLSEILELIQKELKKVSSPQLPAGVVITGGGARMLKLKDFVKKKLNLHCRIGVAEGFFPKQEDPSLTCLSGLVLEGFRVLQEEPQGIGIFKKVKKLLKHFIP